jgi:hypothetical protein
MFAFFLIFCMSLIISYILLKTGVITRLPFYILTSVIFILIAMAYNGFF